MKLHAEIAMTMGLAIVLTKTLNTHIVVTIIPLQMLTSNVLLSMLIAQQTLKALSTNC